MSAQKNKLLEATVTPCMSEEDLHDCKLRTGFFLLFKYQDEQERLKTKQANKQTNNNKSVQPKRTAYHRVIPKQNL